MQKATLPKEHLSPPRDVTAGVILPITAIVFAIVIFAIDTFSPLGIAVAVLYVVVVLLADISSSGAACCSSRHMRARSPS